MWNPASDRAGVRRFVFVHGPKSDSWYWHRVMARVVDAGHEAVAIDLPVEDEIMGLADYAAVVAGAAGNHPRQTIVTHSMAASIAPMIAGLVEVSDELTEQLVGAR